MWQGTIVFTPLHFPKRHVFLEFLVDTKAFVKKDTACGHRTQ